jgi:methyl-accepting chemotaxis protein
MSEKINYDLIKEIRSEVKDIKEDVSEIKTTMAVNTASLQEHISGVRTLKELHIQNAFRIEKLEEDREEKAKLISTLEEERKIKDAVIKKFKTIGSGLIALSGLVLAWLKLKS